MNKTANYQLTVIVPVYNEEGNILRLEKELGEFLKDAKVASCVLFVNDGSKDDSERLIREVCGRNEAFFFLNLDHLILEFLHQYHGCLHRRR